MEDAVWPEEYEHMRLLEEAAVRAGFSILSAGMIHDIPQLVVIPPRDQKKAFLKLMDYLRPYGLMPILRRGREGLVLRAVYFSPPRPRSNVIPAVLLLATLGSLFASGWMMSGGELERALMYVGAMMAVLATHELGHWIAARFHGVVVTLPYFIPAPFTLFGTFGAFIQQKTPAPNRDALFDIGVAGPLAGFVAAIAISLIGLPLSTIIIGPVEGIALPYIMAYGLLIRLVLAPPPGSSILLHPVAFAGWTGMLVTMLNLIPAGSLDGGHIARCVLKGNKHRAVGVAASLAILALSLAFYGGWYAVMAILALFMALFYRHPGPLDDVSSLSTSRKILLAVPTAIFLMCILPF
ncbi:peptidase M50 [Candidatus Bathyarchaeota archaeon ex4484_135]|nr:MAG: peptidase M50 [Candidatus Bathyarchaeota archaeon ex4484_135]